jgi:hypothetical protein
VVDVQRDDVGAAALHLERPEAVPGADVEHAHAVHPLGQAVARDVRAQVEPAVGYKAVAQVDRVVPAELAHARGDISARHSPSLLSSASPNRGASLRCTR